MHRWFLQFWKYFYIYLLPTWFTQQFPEVGKSEVLSTIFCSIRRNLQRNCDLSLAKSLWVTQLYWNLDWNPEFLNSYYSFLSNVLYMLQHIEDLNVLSPFNQRDINKVYERKILTYPWINIFCLFACIKLLSVTPIDITISI